MNLVWHQLRKDLRQHRILMICFWALILVQTVLYLQSVQQSLNPPEETSRTLENWVGVLAAFKFILLFLFVPVLIQSESLVGTTQFWLTRPLPRLQVLLAKTIYFGAVILLPLLIPEVAAFVVYGATVTETLMLVPQVLVLWATYLMVLTLFAEVTSSAAKYTLWIIGLLVGTQVLTMVVQMAWQYLPECEMVEGEASKGGGSSCGVISMLVLLVGGAAVMIYHYQKRRTGWAVAGTVAVALLASSTFWWWRWDFLEARNKAVQARSITTEEAKLVRGDEVQITTDAARVYHTDTRMRINRLRANAQQISVPTDVVNPNPVVAYLPQTVKTTFLEQDRVVWIGKKTGINQSDLRQQFVNQQALAPVLPGARILNLPESQKFSCDIHYAAVPDATFQEWKGKSLTAKSKMEIAAHHYVKAWELPLEKRASFRNGSTQVQINDILYEKNGCEVKLSEIRLNLFLQPQVQRNHSYGAMIYVLLNAKRGEAIVQDDLNLYGNYWYSNSFGNDALRASHQELRFTGKLCPYASRHGEGSSKNRLSDVQLPRDWFRDAVLVCVQVKEIGTVTKDVTIPGLKFEENK